MNQLKKDFKLKENQLEDATQTLSDAKFQLSLQQTQKKDNVTRITSYEQQIQELLEENKRLKSQNQEIESLKSEISRLKNANETSNKSIEEYKQQTSQQLSTQHNLIEDQKRVIKQKDEMAAFHFTRFTQISTEISMLKQQLTDQDKFIKYQQHQFSLKVEENNTQAKELDNLKEENSALTLQHQQLSENAKQLETNVENLEETNKQLQDKLQKQESEFKTDLTQLEEQLKQRPVVAFPVKFEEDIINDAMDRKKSKDIVELIQVLSFFNVSNPDAFERRSMFLSDQLCMNQAGKEVSILTHSDFAAVDHLSRAIFGQQQDVEQVEACVGDGMTKLEKILERNETDEVLGVNYKLLAQQIRELASSNIYLNGTTLYPYISTNFGSITSPNSSNTMFNMKGYNIRMDDTSIPSLPPKAKSNFVNSEITSPSSTNLNRSLQPSAPTTTTTTSTDSFDQTAASSVNITYDLPKPTWGEIMETTSPSAPIELETDVTSSPNIANPNVVSHSDELQPSAPSPTSTDEIVTTNTPKKKFTNYSRGRGRGFANTGNREPSSSQRGGRQRKLFVKTENKQ